MIRTACHPDQITLPLDQGVQSLPPPPPPPRGLKLILYSIAKLGPLVFSFIFIFCFWDKNLFFDDTMHIMYKMKLEQSVQSLTLMLVHVSWQLVHV